MDKVVVNKNKDCWICFNNENNITLSTVQSEKLITNCENYLDTSIVVKSFENVAVSVSCCSYCYEYTNQLIILDEQIKKLQKEISNLSVVFSKKVLERRNDHLQKEKSESSGNSAALILCVSNNKNAACDSSVKTEIVSLEIKDLEKVAKELPSQSPGLTEIKDSGTDKWLEAEHLTTTNEIENVIHSEDEIDVKYSYDDAVSNVLSNLCEQNERMSEKITHGDQKTLKTPVPDLLKCLKTPVLRLERLQVGKSKSSQKIVAQNARCNIKSQIKDPGSSIAESNDDINENTVPNNKSIIAGKDARKQQNDYEGNKSYQCSICGKGFSKMKNLKVHTKRHNEKHPHACHSCGKSFRNPSKLKIHERIHTGEKPFNCSFCTKSFRSKRSTHLRDHERIHTGERPFKCCFCPMSFRRSTHIRQHEKTHTKEKPYKCTFCPKSFKRASIARSHEKVHTHTAEVIQKTHKCSFCPKLFIKASNARRHEIYHSGERPFKCLVCLKSFRSVSELKGHQKTNCEERPHICSICSKSFKNAADLEKHKLFHFIEKPYKCSFCPMSFRVANRVKRHELTHTGERPHKCSICEKTFQRKDGLTSHERKHGETTEEFILP